MMLFVFFFKQKTAYELATGDCSSDVCSSISSLLTSFPSHTHITPHLIPLTHTSLLTSFPSHTHTHTSTPTSVLGVRLGGVLSGLLGRTAALSPGAGLRRQGRRLAELVVGGGRGRVRLPLLALPLLQGSEGHGKKTTAPTAVDPTPPPQAALPPCSSSSSSSPSFTNPFSLLCPISSLHSQPFSPPPLLPGGLTLAGGAVL